MLWFYVVLQFVLRLDLVLELSVHLLHLSCRTVHVIICKLGTARQKQYCTCISNRGVDINPLAAKATARTFKANKVSTADAISDNLVRPDLVCCDDYILFNSIVLFNIFKTKRESGHPHVQSTICANPFQ